MEHHCCIEFLNFQGKLDGSIENLDCIIQHEEYKAITNKAVLENVAPLLRCKNRSYRRRSGVTDYGRLVHKLTRLQVNSPTPKLTRLQVRG